MSKKKTLFFSSEEAVALGVPLIMEVDTTDTSSAVSASNSIILPFDEGITVNLQIDWGDGTALENYTDTNLICTHQYSSGGFYDIKIYNLNGVSRIPWNITNVNSNRRDFSKFYDLKQFGDCEIYQLDEFDAGSFKDCTNLDVTATDIAERCFELNVNAFELFRSCSIVEAKNSANWDVSGVEDFGILFFQNTNIIIDVSNWEMSQATSIRNVFSVCGNINPDVTNWDITSNCTTIRSCFNTLPNFERNLSNWDVSSVTDMAATFSDCTSFTGQGLDSWVTSALTNLQSTFQSCTSLTTVNLSIWDVSGVTTMSSTFNGCTNFVGQGLDSWVTTSLNILAFTFRNCDNLDFSKIEGFDTSGVTNFNSCFRDNNSNVNANVDLSGWDVSSASGGASGILSLSDMFINATNINPNFTGWSFSGVDSSVSLRQFLRNADSATGQGLDTWTNTNSIIRMDFAFQDATAFNVDLSSWNTINVINMASTFRNCINFNQDLSSWDFSNVTNIVRFGENWAMDTNNYDKLLLSLATQTLQPNLTNVVMSSKYTAGEGTNGVTDSIATNKLIDSTQNFTSTVNVGDVIKNGTTYAEQRS